MQSKLPKECREPTGYEKISGTLKKLNTIKRSQKGQRVQRVKLWQNLYIMA